MSVVDGLSGAVDPNPLVTHFPAVNTIVLAGQSLPGKWTLLEAPKKYGWQIQKGFGLSGAFVLPTGDELIVPKFQGEFWNDADWALFKPIRAALLAKAAYTQGASNDKKNSRAMAIDHPELKAFGVTSVVVAEVTPIVDQGGGRWVMTVSFIQYRPPIAAPSRPNSIIPDAAAPNPTAQDAQDIEAQRLAAEADALKGK